MDKHTEDIDDYMSDTMLNKIDDVRPGIVSKSIAKRYKIENEQYMNNNRNKRLKLSEMEKETREEALNKPISADNRGFALMSKMGYKPGMVLGKKSVAPSNDASLANNCVDTDLPTTSNPNALKVPISVDLKLDRKGLGHLTKSKEKLLQLDAARKAMHINRKIIHKDYESRKRDFVQNKTVNKNLFDSQKVCFELDSRSGLSKPHVSWYWPSYVNDAVDEDQSDLDSNEEMEEDLVPSNEKLSSITTYLQITHFYCVWCGCKYEDENDLKSNCPGGTKEAHDSEDFSNDF